jgi:hypothetical protein
LAAQQVARLHQRMRGYMPDRLDEHECNSLDIESPSDRRLLPRKRDGEKGYTSMDIFLGPIKPYSGHLSEKFCQGPATLRSEFYPSIAFTLHILTRQY